MIINVDKTETHETRIKGGITALLLEDMLLEAIRKDLGVPRETFGLELKLSFAIMTDDGEPVVVELAKVIGATFELVQDHFWFRKASTGTD